jgi:hypothetical protein
MVMKKEIWATVIDMFTCVLQACYRFVANYLPIIYSVINPRFGSEVLTIRLKNSYPLLLEKSALNA